MMDSVYLTSVKSAIPFYEKYGFTKYVKSCNDMCIMIKNMNKKTIEIGGKKGKQTKTKTKTNKNKNKQKQTNKRINKNKKTRRNIMQVRKS